MEYKIPEVLENDDGIRPAGRSDECFYCRQKVGAPHKSDCVVVHKKVKIRYTVEIEEEVPYHWDRERIEFHRNDSSWCASNLIIILQEIENDPYDSCLCPYVHAEYLETTDPRPYVKEAK